MTAILFYFFLCDRTNVLGESKKDYSRDLFMFLYLLLIIASTLTSLKKHAADKPLAASKSILYLNRLKNGKGGCRLQSWQFCPDDVASQFSGVFRLFVARQRLHAILVQQREDAQAVVRSIGERSGAWSNGAGLTGSRGGGAQLSL
ncbi:hypothetical protein AXG93_4421s1040 [Marchantia polymorpha subsp. ruderalis]|uniref:Cas1p 10 TM acyl transferase domain-containing protein n=1 Tax=Marchantia polymorpha subsp. ruderalis TaxID=1480154 RepID=A0A176WH71_MARPO|nr:hypothetical protein AXG93_4421s1040 [Marchantia polymorpha subsp. ruderalis]